MDHRHDICRYVYMLKSLFTEVDECVSSIQEKKIRDVEKYGVETLFSEYK